MNFQSFDQLLHFDVAGTWVLGKGAALLVVGEQAASLAAALPSRAQSSVSHTQQRLWFGLPLLGAPFPLFVGAVLTERSSVLQQVSLFAWLEDNYIEQPRAEIWGLTPLGEQPVVFVRDLDMDRPLELWLRAPTTAEWSQLVGVVVADARIGQHLLRTPDQAALALMALDLPADAQPFVATLAAAVSRGASLKAALRQHRKTTDPALMHRCESWRVLARAVRVLSTAEAENNLPALEATRMW